ncbi:hypothetical protein J2W42_001135 [Rhizobium tibeticum]|uniref:hypothetical protein n=1 Tax=Rhizobium tibeticum TaxID=501024 RepID=UPI002786EAD3|nr:hypothetical protein [Rhizobium tibeticum]MDP9808297.1 hypothetical protein [Rhizobium tibeticum]
MAREPQATTVKDKSTEVASEVRVKLDDIVPTGSFALVEGAAAMTLHADASFSSPNKVTLKGLFTGEAVTAAGAKLPISAGDLYVERLKVLRAALGGQTKAADLRKSLLEAKAKIDDSIKANLTGMMAQQRSTERAWRELDAFIKLARQREGEDVALRVANTTVEELVTDDSKFAQLSDAIPNSSELSMEQMVALLVLPEWVGDKAPLKKFGEMAINAKMLVVAGVPESLDEAKRLFGAGGTMADIAGNAHWQQNVVLVANDLRVRPANPRYEQNGNGLYISAATVLAGKIANGDVTRSLADAQAGGEREILLDQGVKPRWDLTNRDKIQAALGQNIVTAATLGNKTVFWGVRNLYSVDPNSSDKVFGQYTSVRVRDYVAKKLIQFMNSAQVFRDNDDERRRELKSKITEFLRTHSGQGETKMLQNGECVAVRSRPTNDGGADDSKLDIDIVLKFKGAIENVTIKIKASKGDGWQEEGA